MGRRAAGGGRNALGPSRLHDPRADLLVGPPRADRPGAEAPGGNPRPHALDPPAELRNPGGLDPEPWLPVLAHPSDGGRDLLSAVRPADQLDGTRVASAEREIDAHRASRSLRDGRVHADRHGGRSSLLDERPRADRRPDSGDPDREREVVMDVLLLSEPEIRELVGPAEALPAVRDAFVRLARGEAILPGVIHLDVPNSGAEVHVKGAHFQGSRFFTIKVASGSYTNPERGLPVGSGIVLVFDSTTGFPRAVLFDNGYLTDLRTGAAGALAADLLARHEVDRAGITGGGTQARYQLAALLGVRTPERVIAFGRSEAKATRFAQEMEKLHGIRVLPAKTVEQAVRGSDVVITVTPSREPLVRAEWVAPGTHITAVGADSPDKQELDVGVLQNADKGVADRLDQCVLFGEIHHAIEAGVLRPGDVYAELGEIAAGLKRGRTSGQEITIADLTGVGVQDAAVAELVVDAALRRGAGKQFDV